MTRVIAISAVAFVAALMLTSSLTAHITAVSPYTFHRDVVPILEARCGRCHGDGSASGLSLRRYDSARGASWVIRQRLVSSHMPPWFAEGAFKAPAPLTPRELNVLMTWATGGAPEGAAMPLAPMAPTSWPLGTPDLLLAMPAAFSFTGTDTEQVHEATLPSAKIAGKMIRAVDLMPGTSAIVRRAEVVSRSGGREQVLSVWQPGESPVALEANAAFQLPRNSSLMLRVHYRRHYGDPTSDRSQVGVYFASRGAAPLRTIALTAERETTTRLERAIRIVAVRPVSGPSGTSVRITAIDTAGARSEIARIRFEADWQRRYVLTKPVVIPAGNTIEVSVIPSEASLWHSLIGRMIDPPGPASVVLEFVN